MKKKILTLAVLLLCVSNMTAQSIYGTWRGMREANEEISSWMYIAFIEEDNSFAMISQNSFADETVSFDVNVRGYGLFSFDGEKLNMMLDGSKTQASLEEIVYSDELQKTFRQNRGLKATMEAEVQKTFRTTKKELENDLNEKAEQFRHCKVVGLTPTKLIIQFGLDDDDPVEIFERDDEFGLD
jgi:hypothetical protein